MGDSDDNLELPDPEVYTAWKNDMTKKLARIVIFREKIPTVLKRCPKCKNLSLEFDPARARLKCVQCDFEEFLDLQ